jgi:hypothetical protein
MKKAVLVIITAVAVFSAREVFAGKYSISQVYDMILLTDDKIVSEEAIISEARAKGIEFGIGDLPEFKNAHKSDKKLDKHMKMLAAVIKAVAQPAPPAAAGGGAIAAPNPAQGGTLRGDLSTNLVNVATNAAALGTNLMVLGSNMADVGANISQNGTNAPALTNNIHSFATNMETIGTNVEWLGATLAMPQGPSIPYSAFLSSGARFTGPYTIHVTNSTSPGVLDNSGNNTVGFLEFDYINRYVFRPPRELERQQHGDLFGFEFVKPWEHAPDIEARIGFNFANSTGTSNYTASTMVGSGDFYSDTRVGLPLFRHTTKAQRQQISLEGEGGMTTDKSFMAVHPSAFVGLGYQTSFRPHIGSSSTNVCGFLSGRLGAGWIDVPSTTGSVPGGVGVKLDGNGLPVFHLDPSPCFGVLLVYPITESLFLELDSNTYIRHEPANWNVSVGFVIPLGKVASIITSPFSSSSP